MATKHETCGQIIDRIATITDQIRALDDSLDWLYQVTQYSAAFDDRGFMLPFADTSTARAALVTIGKAIGRVRARVEDINYYGS